MFIIKTLNLWQTFLLLKTNRACAGCWKSAWAKKATRPGSAADAENGAQYLREISFDRDRNGPEAAGHERTGVSAGGEALNAALPVVVMTAYGTWKPPSKP